jgi:zinc transport system substrate-binding protein
MQVLLEGSDARSGVLDPLGSDVVPGPDGYFDLMNANTDALLACLGR